MLSVPGSTRYEFCLWVVALAALRALSIVALSDVFFWGEELEKGAAAKALLDGIDVAHHRLAYPLGFVLEPWGLGV